MFTQPNDQPLSPKTNATCARGGEPEHPQRRLEYTPRAARQRSRLMRADRVRVIEAVLLESAHLGEMTGFEDDNSGLGIASLEINRLLFFYTFRDEQVVRVTLIKQLVDHADDDDQPPPGGGRMPSWMWGILSLLVRVVLGRWLKEKIPPEMFTQVGMQRAFLNSVTPIVLRSRRRERITKFGARLTEQKRVIVYSDVASMKLERAHTDSYSSTIVSWSHLRKFKVNDEGSMDARVGSMGDQSMHYVPKDFIQIRNDSTLGTLVDSMQAPGAYLVCPASSSKSLRSSA